MAGYLFIIFIIIVCIQLFYFALIFSAFAFAKQELTEKTLNFPVSVLICAKNEAKNLKKNLPSFLTQNFQNFELVLINDGSKDATLKIMEAFKEQAHFKVKIVNVVPNEQFWGSKKYALTLGIKAASHEILLLTDADCKPKNNDWIAQMATHFQSKKELVLGYGAYEKQKSFLNKLIRFETLLTALQYFSFAKIGIPYMGVGRNIAYTKSLFFKANGFVKHMHVKSGDDDLFVNEIATKLNTTICFSPNSFTQSVPNSNFKNWLLQKRRHISTASHYKTIHKLALGLFFMSQFMFYFLAVVLLALTFKWQVVISLIGLRFLFSFISYGKTAQRLQERDLIILLPILEPFLILIQLFIFIKNLISKPTHW